jgi:nitrogen regulatory protein PII
VACSVMGEPTTRQAADVRYKRTLLLVIFMVDFVNVFQRTKWLVGKWGFAACSVGEVRAKNKQNHDRFHMKNECQKRFFPSSRYSIFYHEKSSATIISKIATCTLPLLNFMRQSFGF